MNWFFENQQWILSGVGVPILYGIVTVLGKISMHYGIGIGGRWAITIEEVTTEGPHGEMALQQVGSLVWGSARLYKTGSGRSDRHLSYKYRGTFKQHQAILRFREVGPDGRIIGATVLHVKTRGDKVLGMNAFWSHSGDKREYQFFNLTPISMR